MMSTTRPVELGCGEHPRTTLHTQLLALRAHRALHSEAQHTKRKGARSRHDAPSRLLCLFFSSAFLLPFFFCQVAYKEPTPPDTELLLRSKVVGITGSDKPGVGKATVEVREQPEAMAQRPSAAAHSGRCVLCGLGAAV